MAAAEAAALQRPLLLLPVVATMATIFLHSIQAGAAGASAPAPQNKNMAFIRLSCSSTPYPSLCYTSLVGYSDAVGQDPVLQLARIATNVSLAPVRSVSAYVTSLRRDVAGKKVDAPTLSALDQCVETLGEAADLTEATVNELGLVSTPNGAEAAGHVIHAVTWMSAVISCDEICVDGFAGLPASPVKEDVHRRVPPAERYTSNALSLVKRLVKTNR